MKIRIAIDAAMKHAARIPVAALQASREAVSRLNPPFTLYTLTPNPTRQHRRSSGDSVHERRTAVNIRLPGNVGVLLALAVIAFSCCWIPVASADMHDDGEPVDIPDPVLKKWVLDRPNVNPDNLPSYNITRGDIRSLETPESWLPDETILRIRVAAGAPANERIKDLTGLEYATQVTALWLHYHAVSDLSPIEGLTGLRRLALSGNEIRDLTPLRNLTNLTTLELAGNDIRDLSPLRNLTNLTTLYVDENDIRDTSPLGTLTSLTTLHLNDNENLGANLAGLRNLTNLKSLWMLSINARDIQPLKGLTKLDTLMAYNNQIRDLSPLSGLKNLRTLNIAANGIRDISPLTELTFESLYFKGDSDEPHHRSKLLSYPSLYTYLPIILTNNPGLQAPHPFRPPNYRVPTTLVSVSDESHTVGLDESLQLVVKVLDENSIRFAGVPVVFALTEGEGTLEPTEGAALDPTYNLRYDEEGEATTTFTPGSRLGQHIVVATVTHEETTLEVVFTINVLPGASPPDAPMLSTTGPALPTSLQVSWAAPVYAVEGYEFRYRIEGSEAWIDAVVEGTETSATLSDLIPGTTYEWQVRAQTSVGPGPWSAVNRGTTGYVLLQTRELAPSPVALDRLVFNELRNATDDKQDWLEVKNISGADMSLADWEISIVASAGQDVDIVAFPDYTLPAGEVLLIVNTDPGETDLASGVNIATGVGKKGAKHRYLVSGNLKFPQTSYLLLLRSATDKNGTSAAVEDVAGNYFRATGDFLYGAGTQVWPLQDTERPSSADAAPLTAGEAWARVSTDKRGYLAAAWSQRGYQAGLGYKRGADAATSLGTPGYANTAVTGEAPSGRVSISELMFAKKAGRRTVPQWIELYNNSMTEAVKLEGWQLEVEYLSEEAARRHRFDAVSLTPLTVLPNQTVLLVTWRGETSGHFPEERVYNLYFEHPAAFNQRERRHDVLNPLGFSIRLLDASGTLVDNVGNLDGVARTQDAPAWEVPSSVTPDGTRVSLIRRYEDSAPLPGTEADSWVSASNVKLAVSTYYGWESDIGTPGYRDGGPLPVVLSQFQSVRTDAGVVIRWTTESSVDNAGFNLLRGTSLQGPFTKINPALIAGAGTTGEERVYTFTDATAEPGVVYYYRLEEVSLGGARQQLATVRLRGQVSARGKLTKRWSELKSQ